MAIGGGDSSEGKNGDESFHLVVVFHVDVLYYNFLQTSRLNSKDMLKNWRSRNFSMSDLIQATHNKQAPVIMSSVAF